jgi:hypothetical protein
VGFTRFYLNGTMVCSDLESTHAPAARAFVDMADGPPLRLQMPMGGLMGECAVFGSALSDEEVRKEFAAGAKLYRPTRAAEAITLRQMELRASAEIWDRFSGASKKEERALTAKAWAGHRSRIVEHLPKLLGTAPANVRNYYSKRDAIKNSDFTPLSRDLEARALSEEDCGDYTRKKITLAVQQNDLMYAWLLVPRRPLAAKAPAVICFYGTTSGAGKDTTVGLSGPRPGTAPEKNRAFALDFVKAGFVVLAPDYLRDGERIAAGDRPYDTTRFYEQFPEWSIHGKDAYDTSRAVDYLQSLEFVDAAKIGMTGHSYGGHSTIFAAALEPRIAAAVASGPVSDFLGHGMHWGVPRGAGNSQSMPNLRPYVVAQYPHLAPPGFQSSIENPQLEIPVTFYEFTALIAPRPLIVFQAVGERRPNEEENAWAVSQVYAAAGAWDKVRYLWHAGDHDYPPAARRLAVEWFKEHLMRTKG